MPNNPTSQHEVRVSALAGALGGLLAGLLLAVVINAQGMAGQLEGLSGLPASGAGIVPQGGTYGY